MIRDVPGRAAELLRFGASEEEARAAFVEDCRETGRRLRELVQESLFAEAITVSSRALGNSLKSWQQDPAGPRGGSIERGVLKYLSRATTRSTPYGILAGVAAGRTSDEASVLELGSIEGHRRHVRADTQLLLGIAAVGALEAEARPSLRFVPNNTLYTLGQRLRYFEAAGHPFAAGRRLVAVTRHDVLDALIERARSGASIEELVEAARKTDPEVTAEEASQFVEEVIGSQILIADSYPSPIGDEMLHAITMGPRRLRDGRAAGIMNQLSRICAELGAIPLGSGQDRLESASEEVRAFLGPVGTETAPKPEGGDGVDPEDEEEAENGSHSDIRNAFQIDMALNVGFAQLNGSFLNKLLPVLEALRRLEPPAAHGALREFAEEFSRRYEEGEEVPLCEALDPDSGIRFGQQGRAQMEPSPLLRVKPKQVLTPRTPPPGPADAWKLDLAMDAISHGRDEVRLTSAEIAGRFSLDDNGFPAPFSVMLSFEGSAENLAAGTARCQLISCGGLQPLGLLSRFAHVLGQEYTRELIRLSHEEQRLASALLVQVAYLPHSRLGNVCQTPRFRRQVVSYLSPPLLDPDSTLDIADLRVTVQGGRVKLISSKLGVEIRPRFDHALNLGLATHPPAISFLGALQAQDATTGLNWTWGSASGLAFHPRVVIDDVVVSPRSWRVDRETIKTLRGATRKEGFELHGFDAFRRLQQWRADRRLPRWVALGDMANFLVVDLDDPISVDLFLRESAKLGRIREFGTRPLESPVRSPQGHHAHEIVLSVWPVDQKNGRPRSGNRLGIRPVRGTLAPRRVRDGVLYAKIYGGEGFLDQFLRGPLGDWIENWEGADTSRRWFYVRFSDPLPHLRLRLFADPAVLATEALPGLESLCHPQRGAGLWKLIFDGYSPEVSRYGGPEGLSLAEEFFWLDSRFATRLLRAHMSLPPRPGSPLPTSGIEGRWLLAAASLCALLEVLDPENAGSRWALKDHTAVLGREYSFEAAQFKSINRLYRAAGPLLGEVIVPSPGEETALGPMIPTILAERTRALQPVWQRYRGLADDGRLTAQKSDLMTSLAHMHCIRLFLTRPRYQEAVLLHLLERHWTATSARRAAG